jgi:hypothetical protein
MRMCYAVMAHESPDQVARLVDALKTRTSSFLIHFDKKAGPELHDDLVAKLRPVKNLRFLERRACYWGDFSLIQTSTDALKTALTQDPPPDYITLLSGHDYPIKSKSAIDGFLNHNPGKSFIEFFPLPSERWAPNGGLDRLQHWHFRMGGLRFGFPGSESRTGPISRIPVKRKLPLPYQPYGGSAWWCFSRRCAQYLSDFIENNPAFVRFFRYVYLPEEIFYQTVLLNSPIKDSIVSDDLRFIVWPAVDKKHPATLHTSDFQELASSPKLFARKFNPDADASILEMIDGKLLRPRGQHARHEAAGPGAASTASRPMVGRSQ